MPIYAKPSQKSPQADLSQWLAKAMKIIHGKQTRGSVIQMLKAKANDPVQALADVLVMVVQQLDNVSRKAGVEVPDGVKLSGVTEILSQLAEIGELSGAIKKQDKAHLQLALSVAVQDYIKGEIAAKRIDPAKLQAAVQQSISQMDPEEKAAAEKAMKELATTAQSYKGGGEVR